MIVLEDNVLQENLLKLNNPRRLVPVNRTFYPSRKNMGPCSPLFGKVSIFVAFVSKSMKGHYRVAQQSLECYLKGVNYTVMMVDLDKDPRVQEKCPSNKQVDFLFYVDYFRGHCHVVITLPILFPFAVENGSLQLFFKKHCAASAYLPDTDWMLVLDADTGVVNPNHCVEEWIDDRVDIIFYERFFNWEIASGNYLVRNSEFGRNFLKSWGEWEFIQPTNWNGGDNGVLQLHILKYVLPGASQEAKNCNEIWHTAKDYDTYMAYVSCVKQALGATRLWPGKVRIYRRAHGWVRDGFITSDKWCDADFMLHGWKLQTVGQDGWESPFKQNLDPMKCGTGLSGWNWIPEKRVNASVIRQELAALERSAGKEHPKPARDLIYLTMPDVGICYPNCDKDT
ncbi:hypothetical protein ANCCAN_08062 [Ancylostoma caninum]|uniref:Nucleotide-diphospho-sugar transferase domain-containing protein n=1 Tax=Ancylostoma caninum TaxID=29170 RepID=A0A368GSI8_ANCCA|nr:hypothetical protein ANCCAN_08062 [Ancylostoma caninum]